MRSKAKSASGGAKKSVRDGSALGGKIEKSVSKTEEVVEEDLKKEEIAAEKNAEIVPIENRGSTTESVGKTQTGEEIPAEVAAINEDNETAEEAEKLPDSSKKEEKETKTAKKTTKARKPKTQKKRSKKYQETIEKVEKGKIYPLAEAIKLVKETSYSKFDGTVNLSIRVEKSKKADEAIRGTIKLPHGTGKKLEVAIATDELIEKIKKNEAKFDILLAAPAMMSKLAQVAKILGPKGKMPNPKDGTVVDDPQAALEDMGGNIAHYRADANRNIHISVGKVSWDEAKLEENITIALKSFARFKKDSVTLSATMGPGIKIETK